MNRQAVNFSYWELKQYLCEQDLIVIGSGIVGLSTAIAFKQKNKKAKVLVVERGILPSGASTKNAGFACFGSSSEILDDLQNMTDEMVWNTVEMRWEGLQILIKRLGAKNLNLQWNGGFELFDNNDIYDVCSEQIKNLNTKIQNAIGLKNTYSQSTSTHKNFKKIKGIIKNKYEGQIDTNLMMQNLIKLAIKNDILILNGIGINKIIEASSRVELVSDVAVFKSKKIVVATNGFAAELLKIKDVKPARAQVLITKPIKNLKIKGTFHYQKGYFYFRNIDNRILFGGGRNLDFKGETTTAIELNTPIQNQLDKLLHEIILPDTKFEIEHRWSGIMGVGSEKKPIIEFVSKNVLAAVRMGGMGVAIGSLVGKIAAEKISES